MTAILTEWEKKHLQNIELFLQEAKKGIAYFEEKNQKINEDESSRSSDWLKFRQIVTDLYSSLDYTWYLLRCHFLNKGNPDLSQEATQSGFPYKKKGIKISKYVERDQKNKFLEEKLCMLWKKSIGKETHFWKEIGDVIVSVQPKIIVEKNGVCSEQANIEPGDGESLALLHFYRNCAVHRDLIRFLVHKNTFVEINQATREIRLVPIATMKENTESYYYLKLEQEGYWIELPQLTYNGNPNKRDPVRMLVEVLDQLQKFVVKTVSRLLQAALILPSAQIMLECFIEGCELPILTETSQNPPSVTIIATFNDGKRYEKSVEIKGNNAAVAQNEGCIQILKELALKKIFPKSPYSCFSTQQTSFETFPAIATLQKSSDQQPLKELLHDFQAQASSRNLLVDITPSNPESGSAHLRLQVKNQTSGMVLIDFSSEQLASEEVSHADTAQEILMDECIRLGLIKVEVFKIPIGVQRLKGTKHAVNRTHRMILNEFRQKLEVNGSWAVQINQSDLEKVEGTAQDYKTNVKLIVECKTTNKILLELASGDHIGKGKNKAKEDAAENIVKQLVDHKLIKLI